MEYFIEKLRFEINTQDCFKLFFTKFQEIYHSVIYCARNIKKNSKNFNFVIKKCFIRDEMLQEL